MNFMLGCILIEREEYRRKEKKQKREYQKKVKLQNSLSLSSCLYTLQKESTKLKSVN